MGRIIGFSVELKHILHTQTNSELTVGMHQSRFTYGLISSFKRAAHGFITDTLNDIEFDLFCQLGVAWSKMSAPREA